MTHPLDEHSPLPEAPVRLVVLVPKEREAAFRASVEQFLNSDPSESPGHEEMLEALGRLIAVASSPTRQGRWVAAFLAALYNKYEFYVDVVELRGEDEAIFNDCINVLWLKRTCGCEIHELLDEGDALWRRMIDLHDGLPGNSKDRDGRINWAGKP